MRLQFRSGALTPRASAASTRKHRTSNSGARAGLDDQVKSKCRTDCNGSMKNGRKARVFSGNHATLLSPPQLGIDRALQGVFHRIGEARSAFEPQRARGLRLGATLTRPGKVHRHGEGPRWCWHGGECRPKRISAQGDCGATRRHHAQAPAAAQPREQRSPNGGRVTGPGTRSEGSAGLGTPRAATADRRGRGLLGFQLRQHAG